MGFRDPRVLSQKLQNNAYNLIQAPPDAETAPDNDYQAGTTQIPGGYVPDNATNRPAAPPTVEQEYYDATAPVTYPSEGHEWNVTKGPNDTDDAIAPTRNSALKNAQGYSSGKGAIGASTSMGSKPPLSGKVA
jgi:hypothetical protein